MKLWHTLSLMIWGFMMARLAGAQESLDMHSTAQVPKGEEHELLLEVVLAVIATVCLVAYQIKKYKSKNNDNRQ